MTMRSPLPCCLVILTLLFGCDNRGNANVPSPSTDRSAKASAFVAGKDYTVLARRRFLDTMGFERPVEAFSMLFPKDWTIDGGVRWKSVQACRGEIVSNYVKATSPDGQISFEALPARAFTWADNPMMFQSMQMAAQNGGCQINQPFSAEQYIEGFAQRDLGGQASAIQADASNNAVAQQLDQQANTISQQYGTGTQQQTSFAYGRVTWRDGSEGLLHVGVTNMITRKPDMMSGGVSTFSSTTVTHCVLMRFPTARRSEATKLLGMIQSSLRSNPVWQQAKNDFLTNLGNMEHAGRMDTIRLMGQQSQEYARAQSSASDRSMRNWETQQSSQERQHKQFVQTIREVETYADSQGKVELSSGYNQAWSRGDGTYILSNAAGFDPSSVFQDQAWKEMKRVEP